MKLKCAIVLCLAIGAAMAVDYCNNMRCDEKPHVACNSPVDANGGWGPDCSPDRELIEMTPERQARILDMHNKLRNQQAAGETPHYEPAARMGTLVWDDGLAETAEYNARSCIYDHDKCHNTDKWWISGQNIAESTGQNDDDAAIDALVPLWFSEHKNGGHYGWMKIIKKFEGSSHDSKTQIGHFTQFVWEDASAIGCASSKFTDDGGKQTVLVCNYGYGNMRKNYIYETGPAASKCKTGNNPDYPALCSVDEDYTEEWKKRSGWDLKPITTANGYSFPIPNGCDDDVECRKMKENPSKYYASKGQIDSKPKINILPNGRVTFNFPAGCDQACANKAKADFMKEHPEYGK